MVRLAVSVAISRRSRPEELLLVERSKKLRAFPGLYAFPGGTLDEADASVPVRGLDADPLSPFVAAGVRELFEETGIWLGRGGRTPSAEELRADRRRLLAEEVSLASILGSYGQHLLASDLTPLCRMMTPPFAPVRFDTQFLRGLVDDDQAIEIWEGELVSGDFVDTSQTLTQWKQGAIPLAPPMVVLIEHWTRGQTDLEARIQAMTASYDAGTLHRIYFSPGVLLTPLKTPTRPPATHTNTCIVGERKLYLVDPSPVDEGEQARLWSLLDELVAEGRTLEGILLTHYHPDHVGALAEMQSRYGVPALAHEDCIAELPDGNFGAPLRHGEVLDLGEAPDGSAGWKLEAYHVPGHARGHLAFQESRYGAAIVGDLVSTLSSILVDPRDGHLATYLKSLEFLQTVVNGTLYPGHGPPSLVGKKVIEKTLTHRAEREEQLLGALSSEPRTTTALVEAIYADVPQQAHGLAERSLLSGLIKLEEEGRVHREGDGYVKS